MDIIHIITDTEWCDSSRYALDLCRRLMAEGHRPIVASRKKSRAVAAQFRKVDIPIREMTFGGGFDFITPIKLSKLIDECRERLGRVTVHVHNFNDAAVTIKARGLLKDKSNVKIICTLHAGHAAKTNSIHLSIYEGVDAIIFPTQFARQAFLAPLPHRAIPEEKLFVIKYGVQASETYRSLLKSNGNDKSEGITTEHPYPTAIYMGKIQAGKGLETLLHAMTQMRFKDLRLIIVGTGRGRDVMPLVRLSRALDIDKRIKWYGAVNHPMSFRWEADIVIEPSSEPDSGGLLFLEAMLWGLAAVAVRKGPQSEIIEEGKDGLLVPRGNDSILAEALDKLCYDPTLRQRIALGGQKKVEENYSFDRMYQLTTELYI